MAKKVTVEEQIALSLPIAKKRREASIIGPSSDNQVDLQEFIETRTITSDLPGAEEVFVGAATTTEQAQELGIEQEIVVDTDNQAETNRDIFRKIGNAYSGHKSTFIQPGAVTVVNADSEIEDVLRRDLNGHWLYNVEDVRPKVGLASTYAYRENRRKLEAKFETRLVDYETIAYPAFQRAVQRITLSPVESEFQYKNASRFNNDAWFEYIEELASEIEGREFEDHTYELNKSYDLNRFGEQANVPNGLYSNATQTYNFFEFVYETTMEKVNVDERLAPNLYSVIEEISGFSNVGELHNNSLDVQPSNEEVMIQNTYNGVVLQPALEVGKLGQYHSNVGVYFGELRADAELVERMTNVAFPFEDIDLLDLYSSNRFSFPMFSRIEFNSISEGEFATSLNNSGLSNPLMRKAIEDDLVGQNAITFREFNIDLYNENIIQTEQTDVDEINIYNWWTNYRESGDDILDNDLIDSKTFYIRQQKQLSNYERSMATTNFNAKLESLIKNNSRKLNEIFDGALSHSEPAFYKIQKHKVDLNGDALEEPFQTFYMAAGPSIHQYIDTQVRYDKRYVYRIYVYQFVIGTKYQYNKFFRNNTQSKADVRYYIDVDIFPSVRLLETLYYEEGVYVLDSPPMAPEVKFDTFRRVSDRILVRLQDNVGEIIEEPITIGSERENDLDKLREAQKIQGNVIKFVSDEPNISYEIFRIPFKPLSYQDFETFLKREIKSEEQTSLIDLIEVNQKYYYTFRAVDFHGHISNPTPVYEIELVENNGGIYLVTNIIDLEEQEKNRYTKPMRKYIQIVPTLEQSILDLERSDLEDGKTAKNKQPELGILEEGIWNKIVKIRFTSKHTGKKFDLNVRFIKNIRNE